jgi:hypothetical protein
LGQEIRAVTDPLLDLDTWAAVDSQCDGRVAVGRLESAGKSVLGLLFGCCFCGLVLE